jgi:hypothetical protein
MKVTLTSSKGIRLGMSAETNKPLSVACTCLIFWNPTNPSKGQASLYPPEVFYFYFLQGFFLITSYYYYAPAYPSLIFNHPLSTWILRKVFSTMMTPATEEMSILVISITNQRLLTLLLWLLQYLKVPILKEWS